MDFIAANWLGMLGLVSGLLCVWLLIRENIYTFPLGLLYAVVTVVVMLDARLYADVLLNGYYVIMNAYGWYFWLRGDPDRRAGKVLQVAWAGATSRYLAVGFTVLGTLIMGWYFDQHTDADFAYPDSFTTMASFVAMWMSARKYLDSWVLWFVVDVASVALYLAKAQSDPTLYYYAFLYLVYLWMAVVGYRAWRVHLSDHSVTA